MPSPASCRKGSKPHDLAGLLGIAESHSVDAWIDGDTLAVCVHWTAKGGTVRGTDIERARTPHELARILGY